MRGVINDFSEMLTVMVNHDMAYIFPKIVKNMYFIYFISETQFYFCIS